MAGEREEREKREGGVTREFVVALRLVSTPPQTQRSVTR